MSNAEPPPAVPADYARRIAAQVAGGLRPAEPPEGTDRGGLLVITFVRRDPGYLAALAARRDARKRAAGLPAKVSLVEAHYALPVPDAAGNDRVIQLELAVAVTWPGGFVEHFFYLPPAG